MIITIKQSNQNSIFRIDNLIQECSELKIKLSTVKEELVCFNNLSSDIYRLLDFENSISVWLVNFPFCVVNYNSRDHILPAKGNLGEKISKCKQCKYKKICAGFPTSYFNKFGEAEVKPIPDLPIEVMIEVEPRCNFNCAFCYNHNSFAEKDRSIKSFSTGYVKKIINHVAALNIPIIRFTGGEPLLRKDIFKLMAYAKDRGLEVRLNTNCSLVNSGNINKFKNIVDNILIPIESYSAAKEAKITGFKDSLKSKINAIKLFKKIEAPTVRVGTVAAKENILNFKSLADFIMDLPIDEWELYRPISLKNNKNKLTKRGIKRLINGIIKLREKTGKIISIANAVPFCAIKNLNKLNYVSSGALFDDGHSRIVIDPRGFIKPHYFMDKNIGNPLDIMSAWQHPFMKKMRNLEFLPTECEDCDFKFKCRGGSRFEAKVKYGKINAADPLTNYNNIK